MSGWTTTNDPRENNPTHGLRPTANDVLASRHRLLRTRGAKPVQELHGYPFYEEPLELRAEDAKRVTRVLAEPGGLQPFAGEKLCGGFHPDYTVEWRNGPDRRRALICFGCDEVKLFAPGLEVRHDMSPAGSKELEGVLGGYRKNRPPRAH